MKLIGRVAFRVPILFIAAFVLTGCSGDQSSGEWIRPVTVAVVESIDNRYSKSFSGVVREQDHVKLSFRVAGRVEEIPVEEGQFVRRGDLLARLDPRDYQLQYDATRAEHEQIIAEVRRYKELYSRKNLTDNEYERALAGEKRINAKLRATENSLKDTRLTAPFDGHVQTIYMSENEMVDAGTLIVSLVDLSSLVIETALPPAFYLLRDRFEKFSFSTHHYTGQNFPLEMIGLSAKADTGNLYRLRLRSRPDKSFPLAPGMSVQVLIHYRQESGALTRIPVRAVFIDGQERFVWLYREGRVTRRRVETGVVDLEGTVEIQAGLNPGDMIVTAGIHGLEDGQAVRTAQ